MPRAASRPVGFFVLASAIPLLCPFSADAAIASLMRSEPTLLDDLNRQQQLLEHHMRAAGSHWKQKLRESERSVDAAVNAAEFDGFCPGSKDYPVHASQDDSKKCGGLIYRFHGRNYFSSDLCVFDSEIEDAMIDCIEGRTCVGLIRVVSARGTEYIALNANSIRKYYYKCDTTGTLAETVQSRKSRKASSKSGWCRMDSDYAVSLPFNDAYGCDPSHRERCSWNGSLGDAKAKCTNITACNGIISSAEYSEEDDEPEEGSWVAYTSTATYDSYYPDDATIQSMRNQTKKAVALEYANRYDPCRISSLERTADITSTIKGDDNIPVTFDHGARNNLPTILAGVLVSSICLCLL
mmetsp:Transcript_157757/g.278506  ORF Transcript_157757/g.278506 Transcript_157757/m.278506 type:complete len:353 (-) Transcript_157757:134-1192(-)